MAGFAIVEWSQQATGIVAYIATIEALPGFRGRGLGAELLRRLEGSANAERAIEIGCTSTRKMPRPSTSMSAVDTTNPAAPTTPAIAPKRHLRQNSRLDRKEQVTQALSVPRPSEFHSHIQLE